MGIVSFIMVSNYTSLGPHIMKCHEVSILIGNRAVNIILLIFLLKVM